MARYYAQYLASLSAVLGTALLLLAAARAAGLVTTEKERDCWLSLLATPLTGRDVVLGKLAGNLYSLKSPMALLAGAWGLGLLLDPVMIVAAVAYFVTFLACASFVTSLGLYFSLSSATTMRATGATLATALFIGGGYFFCCCMPILIGGSGSGDEFAIGLAPCMPFLLAWPGVHYFETHSSYRTSEAGLLAAYVLGTIGYAGATTLFVAFMTREFERLAGRNRGRPDEMQPVRAAPPAPTAS